MHLAHLILRVGVEVHLRVCELATVRFGGFIIPMLVLLVGCLRLGSMRVVCEVVKLARTDSVMWWVTWRNVVVVTVRIVSLIGHSL